MCDIVQGEEMEATGVQQPLTGWGMEKGGEKAQLKGKAGKESRCAQENEARVFVRWGHLLIDSTRNLNSD